MHLFEKYSSSLHSVIQLFIPILFLSLSICTAQPIWDAGQTSKELSVLFQQPALKENSISNISGSNVSIIGRISLNERKSLIIQVPYLSGKTQYDRSVYYYAPSNVNKNIVGNIYLGLESHKEDSGVFSNIGVYLPTLPDNEGDNFLPIFINLFGDVDQYESYIPNFTTISFRVNNNTNSMNENGLGVIFRLGISGMIYTGKSDNGNDNFESMLSYALQPAIHFNAIDVLVGFSGKMMLTQEGELEKRVLHQAGVSASYTFDFIRLNMFARIPLNKLLSDQIDKTLGGIATIEF